MIVRCTKEQRGKEFGLFHNDAISLLNGETFRIYCYVINLPPTTEDGTQWIIRPNKIAKVLGISNRTVLNAFRNMRSKGFMEFETDKNDRVNVDVDNEGRLVSKGNYTVFESPRLKNAREQKVNTCNNNTRVKNTQEPMTKITQVARVKNTQDANINMTLDQTEIKQTEETTTTDEEVVVVIQEFQEKESSEEWQTQPEPIEENQLVKILSHECKVTPWKFALLLQQHMTSLKELCHAVAYGTQSDGIKNPYEWLLRGKNLFHNGEFAYTNGNSHIDIPYLFNWFQALPPPKRKRAIEHLKTTLPSEIQSMGFRRWWVHPEFHKKLYAMYEYAQKHPED